MLGPACARFSLSSPAQLAPQLVFRPYRLSGAFKPDVPLRVETDRQGRSNCLWGLGSPSLPGFHHCQRLGGWERPFHRENQNLAQGKQPKTKTGRDPKASSAAAARCPEQVRILRAIGDDQSAIGIDALYRLQTVAKEPELAR